MRIRTAFAIISALAVSGLASAQLTIGDKAPAFPVAGHVKGDKITKLEKGKTYVIEFWATWCGPCIASMPHLSEMADKFKGKVDFVSVNTWDFRTSDPKVKEEVGAHATRVNEWVAKNTEKMRYHIVLDDEKDTIATTWMRAAGRNGIPCAFIVNEEGNIAWIGHPMQMDKPLEEVSNKTWDLAAFKVKFDKEASAAKEAAEAQKRLAEDLKTGNTKAIDAFIESGKGDKAQQIMAVISGGARSNPDLAFTYFKKYAGKVKSIEALNWCSLARGLAQGLKNEDSMNELVMMCAECASMADEKTSAIAFTYHAGVLNSAGKKEEAMKWIEKARAAVDKYEPATAKDNVRKFIEDTAKTFSK